MCPPSRRQEEVQRLRGVVEELEKANIDAAKLEGVLQSDLSAATADLAAWKSRAQQERSINSDLRGDNEALQAEVERLTTALRVSQAKEAQATARMR